MLTQERHQLILQQLAQYGTVKIKELILLTDASESTIRRDLSELENAGQLTRIHGGASTINTISHELSFPEKSTKNQVEKMAIAKAAASMVEDEEYIYLDAGSTTYEMIPYLQNKKIVVVTNGITHIDALSNYEITTYLTGGYVKHNTKALVGQGATTSMESYRFDKCFLGVNGVDFNYGFTTPDPEESFIKKTALRYSQKSFALADFTKLNKVSFSKIADLEDMTLITNETEDNRLLPYKNLSNIKVV
ncbi:DeoR/GlpR family DNA-binding transcription regulator [Sediminibacillus massiliensis]|uniref:DeoR/GlpR family DNA-binding transcription regulator n=1 Tax=Sediminibacillus massiliensis TaxID=1926277 RepID=UPI0009887D08|nr:DeoR/GlpR family DNA-binding transcription regulator [Sediminibacillus massiliensis]